MILIRVNKLKMNTFFTLLFAFVLLFSAITIFIKICIRVRRGGGSIPYFISSGAMDAVLDKEKKAATTMIVERNAQKKMDEQASFDPPEKK